MNTDKNEEFENAMNEGRIGRTHCLWALAEIKRLRRDIAYAASLIQCRIEGDDLSSSGIRDYLLEAVGMTIEEAMATTDLKLWGEEE
tara:strand:- start:49 stop:309 length:261 start_codon:yes stop_codon:yes gene_type:complete